MPFTKAGFPAHPGISIEGVHEPEAADAGDARAVVPNRTCLFVAEDGSDMILLRKGVAIIVSDALRRELHEEGLIS